MFHVQTYIYFPGHNSSFPGDIPVNDTYTLAKAEPYLDFEKLHGHIELTYQGKPILYEKYADLIKAYWDYLLQTIESFMEKGSGRMYLPDQPIPIAFEKQGQNRVLMTVGSKGKYGKWLLPEKELIKTLLDGATRFYKGLSDAFSDTIDQQYGFRELYEYSLDLKKQYLSKCN